MKHPISKIAILAATVGLATASYAASTGDSGRGAGHAGSDRTLAAKTDGYGSTSSGSTSLSGPNGAASRSQGRGHWGYEGNTGPEHWGALSADYHMCRDGQAQSPIDIDAADGNATGEIEFDYHLTPMKVLHNGHTVQVNYAPGSGVTIKGKRYELLQFHFHTPGEHAVGGERALMEVHFVHKSADGQLAVIAAMMKAGEENLALREIWHGMPQRRAAEKESANITINARDLLPSNRTYYRYIGSLTTPPCSEGVNWLVLQEPITVSAQQAERFAKAVRGNNARPLQAVNNRLLLAPADVN